MAEVIRYWPKVRSKPPREMVYPWEDWMDGNIWLCEQGVDFPKGQHPINFRNTLYTKASLVSKARRLELESRTVRKRSIRFLPTHVKVRIISDEQVAFQFYVGHEAPEEPEVIKAAVPRPHPTKKAKI